MFFRCVVKRVGKIVKKVVELFGRMEILLLLCTRLEGKRCLTFKHRFLEKARLKNIFRKIFGSLKYLPYLCTTFRLKKAGELKDGSNQY